MSEYGVPISRNMVSRRVGGYVIPFRKALKKGFQSFLSWVLTPRYVEMPAPAIVTPGSETSVLLQSRLQRLHMHSGAG